MSERSKHAQPSGPSTHTWAKVAIALAALAVAVIVGLQSVRWLHHQFMSAGALPVDQLPQGSPSPSPSGPGLGAAALQVNPGEQFRIGNVLFAGAWRISDNSISGLTATTNGADTSDPKMLTFTMWRAGESLGNIVCSSTTALGPPNVAMRCPATPAEIAGADQITVVDSTVPLPDRG